jgi:hypothetical protein
MNLNSKMLLTFETGGSITQDRNKTELDTQLVNTKYHQISISKQFHCFTSSTSVDLHPIYQ